MATYAKRYERQMAFVGTTTQYSVMHAEATKRRMSLAAILREAIDARYGLSAGEHPDGHDSADPGGTPPE